MPLGIRPYPCSHKLALPPYTYPQPKARDLPATRPIAKTSFELSRRPSQRGEANSRRPSTSIAPRYTAAGGARYYVLRAQLYNIPEAGNDFRRTLYPPSQRTC